MKPRALASLLAVLLAAASARAEEPPRSGGGDPPQKEHGADAIAVPLVSYSSDYGFTFGAVAGAYFYGPGYRPYRHAVAVQGFVSTRGVQNHFLRYDGPRMVGPLRLEARLEYRREILSPFFGLGNRSAPDFDGNTSDERYNYRRLSPSVWLRLRGRPWGDQHPLGTHLGYQWRTTRVTAYDGSVLSTVKPLGYRGGSSGQLQAGLYWETRDNESNPSKGGLEEIAVRVAGRPTGSRYPHAGLTLGTRRFFPLSHRLVLAQRVVADFLVGDVPFFEWNTTGGITSAEGVGGQSSVRGVERNRFSGQYKLLSNSELRYLGFPVRLIRWEVQLGAVAFLDLGRVWHPTVDDGPWYAWHTGTGLGLRLSRGAAVVRMDTAVSPETGRLGLYVTFGQMF